MESSPFPEETYSSDTSCEYNAVAPFLSDDSNISSYIRRHPNPAQLILLNNGNNDIKYGMK